MSASKKSNMPRRSRGSRNPGSHDVAPATESTRPRTSKRTVRELDQLELIAAMRRADAQGRTKLRQAILTAFACGNGRALVAFGELLYFVAQAGEHR